MSKIVDKCDDNVKSPDDNVKSPDDNVKSPDANITALGLYKYYEDDDNFEIGIDEAGRGPLFGRLYTAAVILPKDDSINHDLFKDSKRFSKKSKMDEVAEYIKQNAVSWSVNYIDEKTIDKINIRQSVLKCMHNSVKGTLDKIDIPSARLLVDGSDFKPYIHMYYGEIEECPYITIEGGDNKYTAIAAASILAKVARDQYIGALVAENPILEERYGIGSNKGYGAKKHMDGIKQYGITKWHRKTYGICKRY